MVLHVGVALGFMGVFSSKGAEEDQARLGNRNLLKAAALKDEYGGSIEDDFEYPVSNTTGFECQIHATSSLQTTYGLSSDKDDIPEGLRPDYEANHRELLHRYVNLAAEREEMILFFSDWQALLQTPC